MCDANKIEYMVFPAFNFSALTNQGFAGPDREACGVCRKINRKGQDFLIGQAAQGKKSSFGQLNC
jgi:hypothetical protein